MLDPQVQALENYHLAYGCAWRQPDSIVRSAQARQDTYYKIVANPPLQPILMVSYGTSGIDFKTNQAMPIANPLLSNLGTMNGAAPTSGLYTGIPSGCNIGGNPYS